MKKIIAIATVALSLSPVLVSAQNHGTAAPRPHATASTTMHINSERKMASTTRMASSTERQEERNQIRINMTTARGDNEIKARVESLNKLVGRIQDMKHISSSTQATLIAEVQTLIASISTLKTKIGIDASSTTKVSSTSPLTEDVKSITTAYRVYALIIPQVTILADADKIQTLAASFATVSAKLQARVSAQSTSTNVVALTTALADMNSKVADAQDKALAAVRAVQNLVPDNGDAAVAASNKAALQTGQAAIKAAKADLQAAEKDAHIGVQGVRHENADRHASSTETSSFRN